MNPKNVESSEVQFRPRLYFNSGQRGRLNQSLYVKRLPVPTLYVYPLISVRQKRLGFGDFGGC